jgi:hypothetical protein
VTITNFLANALTSHVYRNQTYATTQVYVGLLDASGLELSGNGYARAAVGSAFPAPTNGISTNTSPIEFPNTATASWVPARFLAFYDASTGGNLLQTVRFSSDVSLLSGKRLRFPAGQITVAFGSVPDGYWEGGELRSEPLVLIEYTQEILLTPEFSLFEYPLQVVP